jgi:hypothetical protein
MAVYTSAKESEMSDYMRNLEGRIETVKVQSRLESATYADPKHRADFHERARVGKKKRCQNGRHLSGKSCPMLSIPRTKTYKPASQPTTYQAHGDQNGYAGPSAVIAGN